MKLEAIRRKKNAELKERGREKSTIFVHECSTEALRGEDVRDRDRFLQERSFRGPTYPPAPRCMAKLQGRAL